MEQLNHSEEEIIKLGKKLISELEISNTSNILARWMVHYISELIYKAENSKTGKENHKKECFDMILKLWSNKEFLPIERPLHNLNNISEVLEVFREKEEIIVLPRWLRRNYLNGNNKWANFISKIKNNSERMIDLSLNLVISEDTILKDKEWVKNHKDFLSEKEIKTISLLDMVIEVKKNSVIDAGDIEHKSKKEKIKFIINEFEELINEQKSSLEELKKTLLKDDGN